MGKDAERRRWLTRQPVCYFRRRFKNVRLRHGEAQKPDVLIARTIRMPKPRVVCPIPATRAVAFLGRRVVITGALGWLHISAQLARNQAVVRTFCVKETGGARWAPNLEVSDAAFDVSKGLAASGRTSTRRHLRAVAEAPEFASRGESLPTWASRTVMHRNARGSDIPGLPVESIAQLDQSGQALNEIVVRAGNTAKPPAPHRDPLRKCRGLPESATYALVSLEGGRLSIGRLTRDRVGWAPGTELLASRGASDFWELSQRRLDGVLDLHASVSRCGRGRISLEPETRRAIGISEGAQVLAFPTSEGQLAIVPLNQLVLGGTELC